MKVKVVALLMGVTLGCWVGVLAQEPGIGAMAFLRRGVDARALGMGGAFVAVADSYSSIYWNPAGLARILMPQIGGMHTDIYGVGIYNNFVAGVLQWDPELTQTPSFRLGMGASYTDMATQVYATDPSGNPIGLIQYSERLISGGGAVYFPRLGYIGATVKVYGATAPQAGLGGNDATAFGVGFDVGLLASAWNDFWFGLAASDIGNTKIKWHNTPTEPTDLILARYTVGAAFIRAGFTLAADYVIQPGVDNLIRVGGEYSIGFLSLRAGAVKRLEGPFSLSAGAGVRLEGLGIDVAWLQNKEIEAEGAGATIVLSICFAFGG